METGWTSELEAGYLEAQTKQRTAYLCWDLVRPLGVSLYDRIPSLAAAALASREEKKWRRSGRHVAWVQQGGGDECFQEEE